MKIKKSKLIIIISVVMIFAVALSTAAIYFSNRDKVVLECGGVKIPESVYRMYIFSCAGEFQEMFYPEATEEEYEAMTDIEKALYLSRRENFWETEIEGKMPIEMIKEKALEKVKLYAFTKKECEENNITLSEEIRQALKESIEYELNSEEIDPVYYWGIKKDRYISFMIDVEQLFAVYYSNEMGKVEVSQDEITEKFDQYREEFAKATVKTVFLKNKEGENSEDKKNLAYEIKEKIENGLDVDALIGTYSDLKGGDNGKFVVTKSSLIKSDFGGEYIDAVLNTNPGDIKVVKTAEGYCINKTIAIDRVSEANKKLENEIKNEKYFEQVTNHLKDNPDYEIIFVNKGLYDSIGIPEILL